MSETPTGLAGGDVIINPPWSYTGSAQRIFRLRRRANSPMAKAAVTTLAVVLVVPAWAFVTCRYLLWGLWRGEQAAGDAAFAETMMKATPGPAVLPQPEERDRL
jgi:hypothetical protein